MPIDSLRVISNLEELRALTADDFGAQRLAWSPMWLKAREWFQGKLDGLPVEHHYDAAGNSWTTLRGDSERALVLGSHLDSVPNGGWLDGCLGVLAGLEILRGLSEEFRGRPPVTIPGKVFTLPIVATASGCFRAIGRISRASFAAAAKASRRTPIGVDPECASCP